jgi:hypothetical protein
VNSLVHLFRGKVVQGKIVFDPGETDRMTNAVKGLEGKLIELKLGKLKKIRSMSQNRYYWGVVIALFAEHVGLDAEEMHAALKMKFLQKHDGPMETVRSTTDLSTEEFQEYLEKCKQLAAEMGVEIPDPGHVAD